MYAQLFCFRGDNKTSGVNRAVTSEKMQWFEKNLDHIHRSIDIATECIGHVTVRYILFFTVDNRHAVLSSQN